MHLSIPQKHTLERILAFILWIGNAALGLYEIELCTRIFYRIFYIGDENIAVASGSVLIFIFGFLYLLMIIFTGEYHVKYVGAKKSWRLFAWTYGIQVFIVLLYWILGLVS
ncbi:MAG: hypothetical protein ACM3PY_13130 [Omnitrophica WOR_2 bacterium]